jgi:hypothetical protein
VAAVLRAAALGAVVVELAARFSAVAVVVVGARDARSPLLLKLLQLLKLRPRLLVVRVSGGGGGGGSGVGGRMRAKQRRQQGRPPLSLRRGEALWERGVQRRCWCCCGRMPLAAQNAAAPRRGKGLPCVEQRPRSHFDSIY